MNLNISECLKDRMAEVHELKLKIVRLQTTLKQIANEPVRVEDREFGMERALIRCQKMALDVL